ncbi:hypothetical protein FF38_09198 [Lucilia cuprina]|uniref:Uncharacterized protein n=1 Tax=Lucilia cuprina TaxID=7375 RepID=A0A0L0BTX0_LUCCU|nr:hypothetical protein FF38_09198 [Lucilia cuprina]
MHVIQNFSLREKLLVDTAVLVLITSWELDHRISQIRISSVIVESISDIVGYDMEEIWDSRL